MKILGVILLAAGILGLVYGGFSYTKETHEAKVGPLQFEVNETERVSLPVWAGAAMAVAGGGLLLFGGRKKS